MNQNFHDVMIVDMGPGDVPESHISLSELLTLSQQWSPAVISHMGWRQKELEEMRVAAKKRFRQSRPSCCMYCGVLIKCDMHRHVAQFHLDLAQLWWCTVSWCTVWKGTLQDCMDHIRGAHDVPWEIKSASLEKYLPPWTVTRQVWSDSLAAQHSGISMDVLLFSDIHLSLVHHYRIHKRGLPHIAFRGNYLSQLRALLSLPSSSGLLCPAGSPEVMDRSPRTKSPALRSVPDDSPPSGLAAMDQYLPCSALPPVGESGDSPLLPAHQTPRRMTAAQLASGSGMSSPTGETDVAGGHPRIPDLSREGPFDVLQDRPDSGASALVLDGVRGCQYRMTSYGEKSGGPDFTPAYGIQLHDPRLLEYMGAPESVHPLSRSREYWLHHLGHEKTLAAALQLQHDAGLILSNVQALQQFVSALNRTSSEVMRVAFGRRPFPADAMLHVVPSYRVIWRLWACGGHLLLRTFGDPCRRRRAMLACRAITVSQTCHSEIRWCRLNSL